MKLFSSVAIFKLLSLPKHNIIKEMNDLENIF